MVEMINNKRLNHTNARIYYYDDGSEILTSYGTDVVKKTTDGNYIRLWKGWSTSTCRHVKTYCGASFRSLPFEDGTYEDTKPKYKRQSFYLLPSFNRTTGKLCMEKRKRWSGIEPNSIKERKDYKDAIESIKIKDIYGILINYQTGIHKELKEYYKGNKSIVQLLDLLRSCTLSKPSKGMIGSLARLCDFDFMVAYNKLIDNNKLYKGFQPLDINYFG